MEQAVKTASGQAFDTREAEMGSGIVKAALYARVSTRDQKSIPDQLADLRKYAELKGWTVAGEYQEQESGKRDTRPVRYTLLKRAWRGEVDVILTWKLDRWGRNVRDLVNTIADLGDHSVWFVSFSDNIDLTTTNGRLFFHILCAFAQFERETIVDRVRAGVDKKRQRMREMGREWGRPARTRAHTARVLALAGEGKSKTAIAAALGISRASVMRILRMEES